MDREEGGKTGRFFSGAPVSRFRFAWHFRTAYAPGIITFGAIGLDDGSVRTVPGARKARRRGERRRVADGYRKDRE